MNMPLNKYKTKKEKSATSSPSIFLRLEKLFSLGQLFEDGIPVKYFPKVLFITMLGIVYIANSHFAEKNIHKINRLEKEIEDLRADYITLKSDYTYSSIQSQVYLRVKDMGMNESILPPFIVTYTNDDLE